MPVNSPKARKRIEAATKRFIAYLRYRSVGPQALSKEELKDLVRHNLIRPGRPPRNAVQRAYAMTHGKMVDKDLAPKATRDAAVDFLERMFDRYSKKTGEAMSTDILGGIESELMPFVDRSEGKAVYGLLKNPENLKKYLGNQLNDKVKSWAGRWKTIVNTELHRASNLGAADAIIHNNKPDGRGPSEISVFKIGPNDGATCLSKGERIRTFAGAVAVEDATDGIWSHANADGKQRGKRLNSSKIKSEVKLAETIRLEFDGGKTLECSVDHPILVKHRQIYLFWEAGNLPEGTEVVDIDACSVRDRKQIAYCLKNRLSEANGCADFWEFTLLFRDELLKKRAEGKTILQLSELFGGSRKHRKYIAAIVHLGGGARFNMSPKTHERHQQWRLEKSLELRAMTVLAPQMHQSGKGVREIAAELGVSYSAVLAALHRAGIDAMKESLKRKDRGGRATWQNTAKNLPESSKETRKTCAPTGHAHKGLCLKDWKKPALM